MGRVFATARLPRAVQRSEGGGGQRGRGGGGWKPADQGGVQGGDDAVHGADRCVAPCGRRDA